MQNKIININPQLSMSSKEMSELTNIRHDSTMRTIKSLIEKGILQATICGEYKDSTGRTFQCYFSDKRDSLVVVARLSPEFTAKVVDRWQELESKQYYIPKTYAEALQLCADQAKEIETLTDKNKEQKQTIKNQTDTIQKNGDTLYYIAKILHDREEDKKDIQDLYK